LQEHKHVHAQRLHAGGAAYLVGKSQEHEHLTCDS